MPEVIIYTKKDCPYSKDCMKFFNERKVMYHEFPVDNDVELKKEMEIKSGNRTDTPQVFIDSHHIGSFDDLKALDSQGKLNEMLGI